MSVTINIHNYIKQLEKTQADIPETIYKIAKEATLKAIEVTTENTPVLEGEQRGANTVTGKLKQGWAKDSVKEPQVSGDAYVTVLRNSADYASYVNDGHRMHRHFVPGLYIDENGLISRNVDGKGGLVVGTKTKYVPGVFMKEKGEKAYQKAVETLFKAEIERLMKK